MRGLWIIIALLLLASCSDDELSYVSIKNDTGIPIFALPYSSEYTNGDWIQPGVTDEFYSIGCDCLDGFEYFAAYYDSLIVYIKDMDQTPVKFYKDGTTVNYDPTLNPFVNPDVWRSMEYETNMEGGAMGGWEMKHIMEHYFAVNAASVKSLSDTINLPLNPAH